MYRYLKQTLFEVFAKQKPKIVQICNALKINDKYGEKKLSKQIIRLFLTKSKQIIGRFLTKSKEIISLDLNNCDLLPILILTDDI